MTQSCLMFSLNSIAILDGLLANSILGHTRMRSGLCVS